MTASASEGKWDYVVMMDTDLGTGQQVGYLMLHVDVAITNKKSVTAAVSSPTATVSMAKAATVSDATNEVAALVSPAVVGKQEETVLGALSGEGDFDQALTVVAAETANMKADLPGLSEFLLARRSGDTEGFKQWTLTARPLQLRASKDATTGASLVSYRRLLAELRVQVKLGPDYKEVMAGLQSANAKTFNAAVDKVVLATNKATNGGIDYGDYAVKVLHSLKSRATPVPYTQRTKDLGITNSAQ